MSQNAKQSSLQVRRCATPSFFVVSVAVCFMFCLCTNVFVVCCCALCVCQTAYFHLAICGCNMWEMKHAGDLHILWMHVDGSP